MHGSMGASDLGCNTVERLLGTDIGAMMRYGDSGRYEFFSRADRNALAASRIRA